MRITFINKKRSPCKGERFFFYKRFIIKRPAKDKAIPVMHFAVSFSLKSTADINEDNIRLAP